MEEGREATAKKMRIFVGGLGESVTDDDLRRMFGPLGVAEGVDILRTKGRSFAYVDFCPSSLNSVSKLFSTYNGCVWKGGRLRLEKAREHYLDRLKREWAEEGQLASRAPSDSSYAEEDMVSSNKLKKVINAEKEKLRIYFPNLRKVKLVPLSGTGKHKYSFQRVEIPTLPINFCDCEEHSICHHTAKEKQTYDLETQSGGINEEELNVMNSVMNKLLERENISNAAHSGLPQERENSVKSGRELQFDKTEADSASDEDNLIINAVTRRNHRMGRNHTIASMGSQESGFKETQTSTYGQNQNTLEMLKKKAGSPNKKRKPPLNQGSDENGPLSTTPRGKVKLKKTSDDMTIPLGALAEPESGIQQSATIASLSQNSSWRELVRDRGNTTFSISHILPGIGSSEEEQAKSDCLVVPDSGVNKNKNLLSHGDHLESQSVETNKEKLVEAQPAKPGTPSTKSGRGASWLQKSSWTQLVAESKNSLFSIAQILPSHSYEKQASIQPNSVVFVDCTDSMYKDRGTHYDGKSAGDGSVALEIRKDGSHVRSTEKNEQTDVGNNEALGLIFEKKHDSASKPMSAETISIGESCSFKRSATSLKEWAKAKAALSGSLKRKEITRAQSSHGLKQFVEKHFY